MDAFDRAIDYATKRGEEDGRNAAGWYVQDTIGGRASGDPVKAARYILRGIDNGDSAVTDGFPFADLSGEWADTLTGPQLVMDALAAADAPHGGEPMGHTPGTCETCDAMDAMGDICEAYEFAFSTAAQDEIERAALAILPD